MELRPYQGACMETLLTALIESETALVQAPTGAGKTAIVCSLLGEYMTRYPRMRVLVLAHQQNLVRQFAESVGRFAPRIAGEVRIVCEDVVAEMKRDGKDASSSPETGRLCVGTRQSVAGRIEGMGGFNLMVVDEAHRIPPKSEDAPSQYEQIYRAVKAAHPTVRLLGVTATPFRTDGGLIYGNTPGVWFPRMTFKVSMRRLMDEGYLCKLVPLVAEDPDLSHVRKRGGEFIAEALGEEMGSKLHLGSAVKALREHAEGRSHIVCFAVTIEHARRLTEAFLDAGETATVIHSKLSREERQEALASFAEGRARIVVNVGVLTEGWDCPKADCILMCRPTASLALWIQMVGRGLRIAEGKEDCLLLDLAGNWNRLGDPTDPDEEKAFGERKKRKPKDEEESKGAGGGLRCPVCENESPSGSLECDNCGYIFKQMQNERVQLSAPEKKGRKSYWDEQFGEKEFSVLRGTPSLYSARSGEWLLRMDMDVVEPASGARQRVSEFVSFGTEYWKLKKLRAFWKGFCGLPPCPTNITDAMERCGELKAPSTIVLGKNKNGYLGIRRYKER